MNKQTEALKLALDYIVATNKSSEFWLIPASNLNKTVTAIKEALAQPEQEPVAVKFPRHEKQSEDNWTIDPAFITRVEQSIDPETPWDFIPGMEQVETTLLALEVIPSNLYTIPPQRTWVGLTDEEIILIVAECAASHQHTDIHFARAIEAAHGIKENA